MGTGEKESNQREIHLTEEWIRDRLNLEREQLDNVKALSLPGTYHEKISTIGKSLQRFTRLKELDLSRNSIAHLHGLENLSILESLNLYYNQIDDLEDLKLLRNNPKIKRLDLRLNPVSKHVADYRQLLIGYLPNLEYLDDRPIKDSERIEASQYLAHLIGQPRSQSKEEEYVPSSNFSKEPKAQQYRSSELGQVLESELESHSKHRNKDKLGKSSRNVQSKDQILHQWNENTFKNSYATFTPSPSFSSSSLGSSDADFQGKRSKHVAKDDINLVDSGRLSKDFKDSESQFCAQFLNLVEQFWDGPNSLQDSPTFIATLKSTFRDYTRKVMTENRRHINQQHQEIESLTLENSQLNERLRELKASQESELVTLRAKVNQLEDQLRHEQSQRSTIEKMKRKTEEDLIDIKHQFSEYQMQAKCQSLSARSQVNSEVNQLKSELGRYRKLEDTVVALKENQIALSRTNEKLSKELGLLRSQQILGGIKDQSLSQSLLHV